MAKLVSHIFASWLAITINTYLLGGQLFTGGRPPRPPAGYVPDLIARVSYLNESSHIYKY